MAARPTWKGHLKLSLVSCPVALYNAISPTGEVHFHLINPKTKHRVHMVAIDAETEEPLDRKDLVKGYETSSGKLVMLTNEEINAVRLESTKTIDIEEFVPAGEIDRLYWDNPYYLVPDGELGAETFAVIRSALEEAGQIALGRVVIAQRERLLAIEARPDAVIATSLRSYDEVRDLKDIGVSLPKVRVDADMIDIAGKIIAKKSEEFDPSKFKDRYEDALRDLVKRKEKGQEIVAPEAPKPTNVINLMDALKASLKGGTRPGARSAVASAAARRPRTPQKTAPHRKTSRKKTSSRRAARAR